MVIFGILSLFLVPFLEGFFVSLFGFRLLFLLSVFFFKKVDWRILLPFVFVISLVCDVLYHYPLGFNSIFIGIFLFFIWLTGLFFHSEFSLSNYAGKFLVFFLYLICFVLFSSFVSTGYWGNIDWQVAGLSVVKAGICTLACFLSDIVWSRFRSGDDKMKIRSEWK